MHARSGKRWLTFSLKTLFIVVTVLACWLGYELNWIRQRHEVAAGATVSRSVSSRTGLPEKRTAPGLLWLFGEHGYVDVILRFPHRVGDELTPSEEAELQRAEKLFPEADVNYRLYYIPRPERPARHDFNVARRPISQVR